ncbi:hypothetical protein JI435_418960 [Parastagonospora nodorum SN15]|uniref:Uncharacterized protein n=1 Tax=Phaeosphaeria nodorum (strain SN15 / ATCC MYA-4574 / FGSC 10173) TaxID=321614 RepID=A0A7U2FD30_PHANO|nr:hypothetical protein JI435_418960 [Parastagonospora nodorum SN15]
MSCAKTVFAAFCFPYLVTCCELHSLGALSAKQLVAVQKFNFQKQ